MCYVSLRCPHQFPPIKFTTRTDLIQGVPVRRQSRSIYLTDDSCISSWDLRLVGDDDSFPTFTNIPSGSVPFLLKEHLSYSQLATFALASYPYSLKLLWSPIVDSVYFPSVGRRKSWIIPMQIITGSLMLYISINVQKLLDNVITCLIKLSYANMLRFSQQTTSPSSQLFLHPWSSFPQPRVRYPL